MIKELDAKNFAGFIGSGISMVDFWADWCGPCRMIAPVIQELANENNDVAFGKLNVDDCPELAGKFDVMGIPTLLFFKDGELQDTIVGVVSKGIIQRKLDALK
ncbi:MAG: thioredoxin [Candidatus Cloacimonetes bacterium]|nr:thioredoxin [Candidatus Cloacimonadota bacterium]NLO12360.1 thioredoxin [Candidatus Cloacimonadota bacterium]